MKKLFLALMGAIALALSASSPVIAADLDSSPGPGDLTWAQFANIDSSGGLFSDPSSTNPRARVSLGICSVDVGSVYRRSSGSLFSHGTIGVKPTTTCSAPMQSLRQSTVMYKSVWWGLQKVAGPFVTTGEFTSSLTTKTVEVICADYRWTSFTAIVSSSGIFPSGAAGSTSAWEEGSLDCGTN